MTVYLVWVENKTPKSPIKGSLLVDIKLSQTEARRALWAELEKQRCSEDWETVVMMPPDFTMPHSRRPDKYRTIYGVRGRRALWAELVGARAQTTPATGYDDRDGIDYWEWDYWIEEWKILGSPLTALAEIVE